MFYNYSQNKQDIFIAYGFSINLENAIFYPGTIIPKMFYLFAYKFILHNHISETFFVKIISITASFCLIFLGDMGNNSLLNWFSIK